MCIQMTCKFCDWIARLRFKFCTIKLCALQLDRISSELWHRTTSTTTTTAGLKLDSVQDGQHGVHIVLDLELVVVVDIIQQTLCVVLHAVRYRCGDARSEQPCDGPQEWFTQPADHSVAFQLYGNVAERQDFQSIQHEIGFVQIQLELAGDQCVGHSADHSAAGVDAQNARCKIVAELCKCNLKCL